MNHSDLAAGLTAISGQPVTLHALPTGDVFDLFPNAAQTDFFVEHLATIDDVISMCANRRLPAFSAEALIHRFLSTREVTPEDRVRLRSADIGLNSYPVLLSIREFSKRNAETTGVTTDEGRLLLWGTHPRPSRSVFDGVSLLLKSLWIQPHLASYPGHYQGYDIRDLLLDWTRACGVTHWKTENAALRRLLSFAPNGLFVRLGQSAVDLALAACPTDRFLAVRFFRCLQRVAAYQWRGWIIWPSAWLRGAGMSANAIKGASGSSGALTYLLKQHVLALSEGHCAGRRAATYCLRVALPTGSFDIGDFAAIVGVEVDEWGVPQRLK